MANPIWCKLFLQAVRRAASRTCWTAGRSIAMRIPIMAITTNSSTSVNALDVCRLVTWKVTSIPPLFAPVYDFDCNVDRWMESKIVATNQNKRVNVTKTRCTLVVRVFCGTPVFCIRIPRYSLFRDAVSLHFSNKFSSKTNSCARTKWLILTPIQRPKDRMICLTG